MTDDLLATAETKDAAWLDAHATSNGFTLGCKYAAVRVFEAVTTAGDFPPAGERKKTAWVVIGDLAVAGNVWVPDTDALFVSGRTSCEAFVAYEPELQLKGGLEAHSCVVLPRYGASTQELGKITAPVVVVDGADGTPARLDFANKDTYVLTALPPSVQVPEFLRTVRARRTDVIAALRGGESLARFFAPPPTAAFPRVKALLAAIHGGATYQWTKVGEQPALRVERVDGSKQTAVLSKAEEDAMRAGLAAKEPGPAELAAPTPPEGGADAGRGPDA